MESNGQPANNAAIIRIQARVAKPGCNAGAVEGIKEQRTPQAIEACQRDHGIAVHGLASDELADFVD